MKCYLVGGAVRDELLGLEVNEKDWVVVGQTIESMQAKGFIQVGKNFPVFLHPVSKEEYALARKEKKSGLGYHGFKCDFGPEVSIKEDLFRRDLTINAIAKDENDQYIDPCNGLHDIKNKTIRHISSAFLEDPLRVLRVARLAAKLKPLDFYISDVTMHLMTRIAQSGELLDLTPERVWLELKKSLQLPCFSEFIVILRSCDALRQLFPELDALWGMPKKKTFHTKIDSGEHMILALNIACKLSQDPIIRFAVMCHDLGNSIPEHILTAHNFDKTNEVTLIEKWIKRYPIPKKYAKLALNTAFFHIECHKAFELGVDKILKFFNQIDVFRNENNFMKMLIACEADAKGQQGSENNNYLQAQYLKEIYFAAKQIDMKSLLKQNLEKNELIKAIKAKRLQAMEIVRNKWNPS